jgi:hypothetical protein
METHVDFNVVTVVLVGSSCKTPELHAQPLPCSAHPLRRVGRNTSSDTDINEYLDISVSVFPTKLRLSRRTPLTGPSVTSFDLRGQNRESSSVNKKTLHL